MCPGKNKLIYDPPIGISTRLCMSYTEDLSNDA